MAKHSTCDQCGNNLSWMDMHEGKFSEIVDYHPSGMDISTMRIEFEKDVSMRCNKPDLCRSCMIKNLLRGLKFDNKAI